MQDSGDAALIAGRERTMTSMRSTFSVPKMDCPSEERLIRLALSPVEGVQALRFDLADRTLEVIHATSPELVLTQLEPLGLGATLVGTVDDAGTDAKTTDVAGESRVLRQLLLINAVMFVVEVGLGLWADSSGLIADSLDMLADAAVYGISLYAVGRTTRDEHRAARVSGWLQGGLALGMLAEVGRRAWMGSAPVEGLMIGVATLALVANLACVALLARHRTGGVHLRASWIFTTKDALANLGVIVAGVLVWRTGSAVPDLVVGAGVGLMVLWGAVRILRLR